MLSLSEFQVSTYSQISFVLVSTVSMSVIWTLHALLLNFIWFFVHQKNLYTALIWFCKRGGMCYIFLIRIHNGLQKDKDEE